jgi:O-antigen/teichoic acid export membrane protein
MSNLVSKEEGADAIKRTSRVLKNIGGLFAVKGLGVGLRLALVPMTLNYLEPEKFGIWMTLSSIIEMMILFEFGLGNGLRNKLAKSLANNKVELGRVYVSTTYALSAMILLPLLLVLWFINQFIDWSTVLNASTELSTELNVLVSWMLLFYGLKLFIGLFFSVAKANHLPILGGVLELIEDITSLIIIYFLIEYTNNSLLYLGVSKFFIISIIPLVGSIVFYKTVFKKQCPSFRYIELSKYKDILGLSWKFFVIQISSIIIFATDNIIISRLFGPENVTPYAIVFQYFNLITIFFAIVSAPLWSAYTEAYETGDIKWIVATLKKMLQLWLIIIFCALGMILLAEDVIFFWLGRELDFGNYLIVLMGLYVVLQAWNRIFNWLLSGINCLKCTFYTMIIGAIINIPISILFASEFNMGSSGVILGTIVSLGIFAVLCPFTARMYLNSGSK